MATARHGSSFVDERTLDPPFLPSSFATIQHPAATTTTTSDASTSSEVDVLIIGAGPSGLMAAASLSTLGISTRIVDKALHRVGVGHADGFQCRTVEVFEALDVAHRVVHEGNEVAEIVFYDPDPNVKAGEQAGLVENHRMPDTQPGTSYFRHMLLGQGRVESFLIDAMKERTELEVERLTVPSALNIDASTSANHADPSNYPVSVTLQRLAPPKLGDRDAQSGLYRSNLFANGSEGTGEEVIGEETVRAKYVLGCDGARSWVRRQLGYHLEGDSANTYWGVVDCKPVTDFPTIRMKNAIHSALDGSILTVPRERGYVRFYVQMGSLAPGQRVDRSEVTIEKIIEKAQRILKPYKFECPEVEWYTCYEIGQRLCDNFEKDQRVFIAGDACHTHSPKAGQGMNVSMMDAWNLSWKLAYVCKGLMKPEVLSTYQLERHAIAQELIDFDYKFSRLFSGKPITAVSADGVSAEEFQALWKASGKWTTGTAVVYEPSSITLAEKRGATSPLAKNIIIGSHFPSFQVVCVNDAQDVQLQHRLKLGPWYLVAFPGAADGEGQKEKLNAFAVKLEKLLNKRSSPERDLDSVIQTITVFSGERLKVKPSHLPSVLQPTRGPHKYLAQDTFYVDDASYHSGHGHAYKGYGISTEGDGVLIVVRPDQHVAGVVSLTDMDKVEALFDQVFV